MSGTQDASVSPTSVELPTGGTVRPVVRWGTDVMHRRARPVTSYDEELRGLVADMVATMYAAQGVGLAACQIGVDLAVFAFDCPDEAGTNHRGVVCNPVVELREGRERRLDDGEEGCLSYPGAFVDCARPDWARVTGQGVDGEDVSYEGDGLLARCLQHEADHIEGTVFGDRISDRARKKLRKAMEAAAEDYPLDWPLDWPVGEDVGAPGRGREDGGTTGPDTGGDDTVL
jgi:peptide deformylase